MREEHLAQAVTDDKLTQEEADEKLAEIEERISTFVNEGPPERPEGPGTGPGGPAWTARSRRRTAPGRGCRNRRLTSIRRVQEGPLGVPPPRLA